jgi:hypothetical protein
MDALGFLIILIPIFYPTIIALGYVCWLVIMLCIVTSCVQLLRLWKLMFCHQRAIPGHTFMSNFKGRMFRLLPMLLLWVC